MAEIYRTDFEQKIEFYRELDVSPAPGFPKKCMRRQIMKKTEVYVCC